jgi:Sap, sulfolipid-1-addressing protein
MSLTLLIAVALLGLAAIDPIGIAAMPLLLVQKHPYRRSAAFLSGSFSSLVLMGLLFAKGFGQRVLHFEDHHTWLVPGIELLAGLILLGIAATVFWRQRTQPAATEPSARLQKHLKLSGIHLFLIGAALVAIQSVVDVVFVIAMIRVGQLHLSTPSLLVTVSTYAIAALAIQLLVVAVFRLSPANAKEQTLQKVHLLINRYANQLLIGISFVLGSGLIVVSVNS